MSLTTDQLTTLGNHIQANQAVAAALAAGNLGDIRDWYNGTASPEFWVLKNNLDVDTAIEAVDWAADYAAIKDDMQTFLLLFRNGSYPTAGAGARAALNEVLSGASDSKQAILAAATRKATEAETLFAVDATGPGGGDGSAPMQSANTVFTGDITTQDVDLALELTA